MRDKFSFGMIFLVGLIAGILTMNFGKSILLENTGLLDETMLKQMSSAFPDSNALFAFVLRKRLILMAVMVLLATTYLGMVACGALDLWYGFSTGAFLAAALLRYGFKGILLVASGVLPQYLFYGPALYALLLWCDRTCRMIYCKGYRYGEDAKTPILLGRVLPLVFILVGLLIGCFLESYVNPGILKGFIRLI